MARKLCFMKLRGDMPPKYGTLADASGNRTVNDRSGFECELTDCGIFVALRSDPNGRVLEGACAIALVPLNINGLTNNIGALLAATIQPQSGVNIDAELVKRVDAAPPIVKVAVENALTALLQSKPNAPAAEQNDVVRKVLEDFEASNGE